MTLRQIQEVATTYVTRRGFQVVFGGGGLIWVRLMVLDEDLDDARELLAANP